MKVLYIYKKLKNESKYSKFNKLFSFSIHGFMGLF